MEGGRAGERRRAGEIGEVGEEEGRVGRGEGGRETGGRKEGHLYR